MPPSSFSPAQPPARAALTCTEPGKSWWGTKSNIPRPSSLVRAKRVALNDLMSLEDPDPAPKRGEPATGLLVGGAQNGLWVHEGQILHVLKIARVPAP